MRHYDFFLFLMVFCLPAFGQEDATPVFEPETINESVAAEQKVKENVTEPQETSDNEKEVNAVEEEVQEVEIENTESQASPAAVKKALFRKGELTDYGTTQILPRQDFAGIGFGLSDMDGYRYLSITPDFNLIRGNASLGAGFPLRLKMDDLVSGEAANYSVREQDWDEVSDFLRPLRYFTWGRKEDNFYVDINRVHAVTIGHGQLLRNYMPNLDIDEDRLFLSADAYGDFGGVEILVGALPVPNQLGFLGFIKPLSFISDDPQLRSLSLGLSYVSDFNAPPLLETVQQQTFNHDTEEGIRYAVNSQGNFLWDSVAVHGVGVDGEFKVYKKGPLDIKVYADYSHLFFPSYDRLNIEAFDGGGFTAGALFRLSYGARLSKLPHALFSNTVDENLRPHIMANHAFRFRAETRTFGAHYLPTYFNAVYSIQKLQMGNSASNASAALPTKIAALANPEDTSQRVGGYLELSYRWLDNVGVTAIYEDALSTGTMEPVAGGRQVVLHIESQTAYWAQVFATYHYFTFDEIGKIFQFETDNELFFAGMRIQVLPFLFINARTQRTFGIQFTDEDLLHRRSLVPDGAELGYTSLGLNNAWTHTVEAQLGWQF